MEFSIDLIPAAVFIIGLAKAIFIVGSPFILLFFIVNFKIVHRDKDDDIWERWERWEQ